VIHLSLLALASGPEVRLLGIVWSPTWGIFYLSVVPLLPSPPPEKGSILI